MSDERPTIKAFQKRINPETEKEEILLFLHEPVESYEEKENRERREWLSARDKAIAEKAAKLIARDYGEVIKKLEDE